MPNWERTPPVNGMSVEEIKRRVAAGIENRRKSGELRPADLPNIVLEPEGPQLNKQQRRVSIQSANLCIYALANNDRHLYCEGADAIFAVQRVAGLTTQFTATMLKGVAEQAAEVSGEPFNVLDQLARSWLKDFYTPSNKVISLPKGDTYGKEETRPKGQDDPKPPDRTNTA